MGTFVGTLHKKAAYLWVFLSKDSPHSWLRECFRPLPLPASCLPVFYRFTTLVGTTVGRAQPQSLLRQVRRVIGASRHTLNVRRREFGKQSRSERATRTPQRFRNVCSHVAFSLIDRCGTSALYPEVPETLRHVTSGGRRPDTRSGQPSGNEAGLPKHGVFVKG